MCNSQTVCHFCVVGMHVISRLKNVLAIGMENFTIFSVSDFSIVCLSNEAAPSFKFKFLYIDINYIKAILAYHERYEKT